MDDTTSPTPAPRVSISPAREAYLAYERSSPATRRPLSDFIPHLRLAATMAAYGRPTGSVDKPGDSPMPEHGSMKSVPIQEDAEDVQAEAIEDKKEQTVFLEQELSQLLNMEGDLEVKQVVRIALVN